MSRLIKTILFSLIIIPIYKYKGLGFDDTSFGYFIIILASISIGFSDNMARWRVVFLRFFFRYARSGRVEEFYLVYYKVVGYICYIVGIIFTFLI